MAKIKMQHPRLLKVWTKLGKKPKITQEGPFIFRINIETEAKHPWTETKLWDYRSSSGDSLVLYTNDIDNKTLSVNLPALPEDNWYEAIVLPGSRYSLVIMVYPAFAEVFL